MPRLLRSHPHSLGDSAQSILTSGNKPRASTRRAHDARRVSAASPLPRETSPSEKVSRDRFASFHRPADMIRRDATQTGLRLSCTMDCQHPTLSRAGHPRHRKTIFSYPSALSSSPSCSVTSRNGERVPTAQQGTSPDFRPLLLRPHSQPAAFESPGRPRPGTGCQAGSHRPSCVSRNRF